MGYFSYIKDIIQSLYKLYDKTYHENVSRAISGRISGIVWITILWA